MIQSLCACVTVHLYRLLQVTFCSTDYESIFAAFQFQRVDQAAEMDFFWFRWSNSSDDQLIRFGTEEQNDFGSGKPSLCDLGH